MSEQNVKMCVKGRVREGKRERVRESERECLIEEEVSVKQNVATEDKDAKVTQKCVNERSCWE